MNSRHLRRPASRLALNEIGLVRIESTRALVFDPYRDNRQTGSFVLIDRIENATLGAGMVERAVVKEAREPDHAGLIAGLETAMLREFADKALRELARPGVLISQPREEN